MRRILKYSLALVLIGALLLTNGTLYLAKEKTNTKKVNSGRYSFEIEEQMGGDRSVIRTHKNREKRKDGQETKELLSVLGMDKKHIDDLTEQEVQDFAEADMVMVSVSYSKVNENGDVVYLDEETALKEAEAANEFQEANLMNKMSGIATASYDIDVSLDSYMKITYSVRINGETCESIVIGEWLTMPFFRAYDSIGACAKYISITPGTAQCSITYDCTTTINGTSKTEKKTITPSKIEEDTSNGWSGIAAVFFLPSDIIQNSDSIFNFNSSSIINSNLVAIFKYQGKIELPDQRLNFNALATYTHMTVGVQLTAPGVSVAKDGANFGIGLDVIWGKDKRTVLLEINYVPS